MARPLRIEYPGAVYHLTSRGNGKGDIFLADADREIGLRLLGDVCAGMVRNAAEWFWTSHRILLFG